MKFQTFSRQDDEGFIGFLLMRDLLYVQIPKNDTSSPFSCSIVFLCTIFSANRKSDLCYRKVWFFCPFFSLKLCFVFICLFFNLNFQKSICFCSWCQKTTLWRIFLGYAVEHSTAFTKNNARTGNPTCALFPGASLCQWLCYLKID